MKGTFTHSVGTIRSTAEVSHRYDVVYIRRDLKRHYWVTRSPIVTVSPMRMAYSSGCSGLPSSRYWRPYSGWRASCIVEHCRFRPYSTSNALQVHGFLSGVSPTQHWSMGFLSVTTSQLSFILLVQGSTKMPMTFRVPGCGKPVHVDAKGEEISDDCSLRHRAWVFIVSTLHSRLLIHMIFPSIRRLT